MPTASVASQGIELAQERRTAPRLRLPAMLTHVQATPRRTDSAASRLCGHAYDISETGVRIELDEALAIGDRVDVIVELPWAGPRIDAEADVIWVNDVHDDPGPRRMALKFRNATLNAGSSPLSRYIESGLLRAAA